MTPTVLKTAVAIALLVYGAAAHAADPVTDPLRSTTLKLIELLVEQGVLTRDKADALIREANQPAAPAQARNAAEPPAPPAGTVRVPYVPEFVRKELKDEIRQELSLQAKAEGWAPPGAVPEWVRRITWDGDVRFRYEHDNFAHGNAPAVSILDTNRNRALTLLNTTENRDRLRVRARFGLTANIDDAWSGGIRLATGSLTEPVSTNQTLGNYGNRFTIALDQAYIRYEPYKWANAVVGRFANPWFGSDLVWDPDLNFDGVAVQLKPSIADQTRVFLTVAAMPIQEIELSKHDKWLFGAQVGLDGKLADRTFAKIGLGYYRYSGIVGQISPAGTTLYEYTAPQYAQKGNTYYNISSDLGRPLLGLASGYRLANLTASADTILFGTNHLMASADYVKNFGFDRAVVSARVGQGVEAKTKGYQLRLALGQPEIKARRDWQILGGYKYLERDAVPDAFTDSDFRLGGTDAKGYIVGGSYGLARNTGLTLRYFSGDAISGAPLSIDVLHLDLNLRF